MQTDIRKNRKNNRMLNKILMSFMTISVMTSGTGILLVGGTLGFSTVTLGNETQAQTIVKMGNADVKISSSQVKNIVFAHSAKKKSNSRITKLMLMKERGFYYYDVIFFSENIKYTYKVDANSGKILKNSQEIRKTPAANNQARGIFSIFGLGRRVQYKNTGIGKESSVYNPVNYEDYSTLPYPSTPSVMPTVQAAASHKKMEKAESESMNTEEVKITPVTVGINEEVATGGLTDVSGISAISPVSADMSVSVNDELIDMKNSIEYGNYKAAYNEFFEKYTYLMENLNKEDVEYVINIMIDINENEVKVVDKNLYKENRKKFKILGIKKTNYK